jgi:predicted ATP-dependent serine protease
MSSFRRITTKNSTEDKSNDVPVGFKIPGVKSWINNGLGLVSLGNKQVDELLGGGLVLGTVFLIETDSFSNYGETLFLYSLSESISMQHETLLVSLSTEESTRLIALLPYNQTYGVKNDKNVFEIQTNNEKVISPTSVEINKGLNIAWQYAKYLPKTIGANLFVVIGITV